MLKSSCIQSMACFSQNRATLAGMVILDYRESKRGSATYILDGICTSETGIISNGRTDTRKDSVGNKCFATNVWRV